MKKFSKILTTFFTTLLVVLGLVSCGPTKEKTQEEFEKVQKQLVYSDLNAKPGLTANFELRTELGDFQISYTTESEKNSAGDKYLDVSEDGKTAVVNAPFIDEQIGEDLRKAKLIAEFHRTENNEKVVYGNKSFNVLVGERARPMNYDQFLAVATGEPVAVEGVVTYYTYSESYGNMNVYLQDENKGGYYIYRLSADYKPLIVEGNKLFVEGVKDVYSGMHQAKSISSLSLISTENNLGEAEDVTDVVKNAKNNSAKEVSKDYVGRKIKLTEFVVTELPDIKDGVIHEGKDYSVMGNVGLTNMTMRVKIEGADIENINALVKTLKVGDNLSMEGVGEWYNGFQLTTVSAAKITNNGKKEYTDTEKVALDKGSLELAATVVAGTTLELPATGTNGTTITWASSDETILGADGKAANVLEDQEVTLTATIKAGEVTDTKEFKVKVSKMEPTTVAKINAACAKLEKDQHTELFLLEGTVVALDSSSRPYVMDKNGDVVLVYQKVTFNDATPLVGQSIKVLGKGYVYNGLYQFAYDNDSYKCLDLSGEAKEVEHGYATSMTGAEFTKAVLTDKAADMNGKYVKLTGTTLVASGDFFNLTYKDGDNDVTISLYKPTALASDVVKTENVGQEVTVYGYSYGCNSKQTQARIVATDVVLGQVTEEEPQPPVVTEGVTFNFSAITEKGTAIGAETVVPGLEHEKLVSAEFTKAYLGNGTGGAYPNQGGFIKFGTKSAAGKLVLTFDEGTTFTKVTIKCHDWYKSSAENPTNSNTISVNGSDPVLAPYTEDGTPGELTFDITASNVITIDITNRVFVWEIVLA